MDVETVSLIIATFVSGSLGTASLIRNLRSRKHLYFAGIALFLFLHDGLCVIERFQTVMHLASPVLHGLATLLLGFVSVLFLNEVVPPVRYSIQTFLWPYVPLFVAYFCIALLKAPHPWLPWAVVIAHLLMLYPAALWIFSLARSSQRSLLAREQARLRNAFYGAGLTVFFFLTDALVFAGISVPPLGTLARVLYLLFLFQTFIQRQVITAEEVLAKLSLFGGVAVILASIYVLLVSWVGDRPALFLFNTLIASFVIIVLFDPIQKLSARITRRFVLTRNLLVETQLNQLSGEIMGLLLSPPEIASRLEAAFKKTFETTSSQLFFLGRDDLAFISIPEGKPVSVSSPLVEYMTLRRGRPFVPETLEGDLDSFSDPKPRQFLQACLGSLRELRADLVLPFIHEGKLNGFFVASHGERTLLSNEQLRLLAPIGRQVGASLGSHLALTTLGDRQKLVAIGELAAGLAHEIKNPLGAIKGAAELLKEKSSPTASGAEEFLDIIISEVKRLSAVVSDFLDYARPRKEIALTSCDPIRVIEHTTALCLRDTKVNFKLQTESPSYEVPCDPDQLKQVLLNLFLNAVQAMKDTPDPLLTVHVRSLKPEWHLSSPLPKFKKWEGWELPGKMTAEAKLEIQVVDNGVGMGGVSADKIFEPFYTTKADGTGLGLAVCQRLVNAMKGTITGAAGPARGAIFTIHIPLSAKRGSTARESLDTLSPAPEFL